MLLLFLFTSISLSLLHLLTFPFCPSNPFSLSLFLCISSVLHFFPWASLILSLKECHVMFRLQLISNEQCGTEASRRAKWLWEINWAEFWQLWSAPLNKKNFYTVARKSGVKIKINDQHWRMSSGVCNKLTLILMSAIKISAFMEHWQENMQILSSDWNSLHCSIHPSCLCFTFSL